MDDAPWLDREAWPWEPRAFHSADGRLHYVDVGEGSPWLFSHGTPTWAFEWRHLITALSPSHRCVAVDHLGFGLSERPDAGYRPEDHAQRFAAFADHLDLHDATVAIHDFGGPIALPWILENLDRVRRVVIFNTWGWSFAGDWKLGTSSWLLGGALGRWLYGRFNLSLEVIAPSAWAERAGWDAVKDQYLPVFPDRESRERVLWPLARALLASSDHYASIEARLDRLASVEVDLVWGVRDSAFTTRERDRWIAHLPHARRLDLDHAGHWPHEEAAEAVVNYLTVEPAPRHPAGV